MRQRGICCSVEIDVDAQRLGRTADLLKALADPTRLAIVAALRKAKEPVCICDFTAAFDLTQPTISHHVAKLKEAGLVDSTRRGIWVYYRLADDLPESERRLLEAAVSGR